MSTVAPGAARRGREPAVAGSSRGEGLFHATVSLGRVAGVEIGLNWSWALIVGLIVWSLAGSVFPEQNPGLSDATYLVMGAGAAALFFACLIAHEIGHAVQAKREGMDIEGITLWVFGGVARFNGMFPSAGAELRIALAGPLVTLVLAAVLVGGAAIVPLPSALDGVVTWLGSINIMLFVFNMLPALPLDGGRVLRAALWYRTGDFSRATRTAGLIGRAGGQAMIVLGLLLVLLGRIGGLWIAFIGWFLTGAAGAETQLAEIRSVLGGHAVRDAMVRAPVTVPADATLEQFMDEVFAHSRHTAYPVTSDGGALGEITFRSVADIPPHEWPLRRVRDIMIPLEQTLVLDEDAPLFPAAVELMRRAPNRALVTRDGRLTGMLSTTDVSRLLELRRLTADGA
jgi:Zn-dependent protease/CBS domain-containing protein